MAIASVDIKVYSGHTMSAQDFALAIEQLSAVRTGIISGCAVTYKDSSTLGISAGWALIRGRIIQITEGDIPVIRPSSGNVTTKYVVVGVNLQNSTAAVKLEIMDTVPSDTEFFNQAMGVAYLQLASFNVSPTTIDSVVATPPMTPTRAIRTGTSDPLPSLGEDGDIYIKITN